MTWATFPYGSVAAAVSVLMLGILGFKLAALWGALKQHVEDLERRLGLAEGKAEGVPDEVKHEVTNKSRFIEGAVKALAHKLGQLYAATRRLKRQHDQLHQRCQDEHGPLPELQPDKIDDLLATPPDDGAEGEPDAAP